MSAPKARRRCEVVTILSAPIELRKVLYKEWSNCTVQLAHQKLAGPDVTVTNANDKQTMLPKLFEFDREMRVLYAASHTKGRLQGGIPPVDGGVPSASVGVLKAKRGCNVQ